MITTWVVEKVITWEARGVSVACCVNRSCSLRVCLARLRVALVYMLKIKVMAGFSVFLLRELRLFIDSSWPWAFSWNDVQVLFVVLFLLYICTGFLFLVLAISWKICRYVLLYVLLIMYERFFVSLICVSFERFFSVWLYMTRHFSTWVKFMAWFSIFSLRFLSESRKLFWIERRGLSSI